MSHDFNLSTWSRGGFLSRVVEQRLREQGEFELATTLKTARQSPGLPEDNLVALAFEHDRAKQAGVALPPPSSRVAATLGDVATAAHGIARARLLLDRMCAKTAWDVGEDYDSNFVFGNVRSLFESLLANPSVGG